MSVVKKACVDCRHRSLEGCRMAPGSFDPVEGQRFFTCEDARKYEELYGPGARFWEDGRAPIRLKPTVWGDVPEAPSGNGTTVGPLVVVAFLLWWPLILKWLGVIR